MKCSVFLPLLLAAIVCLLSPASCTTMHTHFDNHLSVEVYASTYYGSSGFNHRTIPSGGSAVDEYTEGLTSWSGFLMIGFGVCGPDGMKCCGSIAQDESLVIDALPGNGGTTKAGFTVKLNDGTGVGAALQCTAEPDDTSCEPYGLGDPCQA